MCGILLSCSDLNVISHLPWLEFKHLETQCNWPETRTDNFYAYWRSWLAMVSHQRGAECKVLQATCMLLRMRLLGQTAFCLFNFAHISLHRGIPNDSANFAGTLILDSIGIPIRTPLMISNIYMQKF